MLGALTGGVLIGLAVALPPGPNAALCISRTLTGGRSAGLRCGLGTASAHAVYAALVVAGVDRASNLFSLASGPFRIAGGLVLAGLGLRLGFVRSVRPPRSLRGGYAMTLGLGLANPLTPLYFTAAMALGTFRPGAGPLVVAGVFAGSAAWWAALATAAAAFGRHLDDRRLSWAKRVAAAVMAGFGLAVVASAM